MLKDTTYKYIGLFLLTLQQGSELLLYIIFKLPLKFYI
uniref:Uncharacterized protein n=1 Tax=Heterorhabditis bacteriophora TaxID=37862 RepID=A0A1I7X5E1_HETBA